MDRVKRYLVIIIPVILLIAIVAVFLGRDGGAKPSAADPQPAAVEAKPSDTVEATPEQIKQIKVEPVKEQAIDLDLETTGKVGFNEDRFTPVIAPYNGRVLEVMGNKGDPVAAGEALVAIDSADLVQAANDLSEATSNADKAKIAVDIAEKAADRARTLTQQEAMATKELQAAESDLARAHEDYRRAQAAIALVRNRIALFGKSQSEIDELANITDHLDRRVIIRAPISGTIVDRKVGLGQYIKPDTPDPLFLISDLSTVWVNADVYEAYLPQIHVGAPVEITIAAYPDRRFPARISAINPTVDAATRTIHVRCLVPNPNGLLKPEMFAKVRIGGTAKRSLPVVPSTAILTIGADSFVVVEESPGHFRRKAVKPGKEIQQYTVVEEGLIRDDRVVTSGVLMLNKELQEK
jgi:cobalt-zinc-cadmium efflux system membrane fusion protein